MDDNIDRIVKRTYRYYYEDGLVELSVGVMFGVIALALLLMGSTLGTPLAAIISLGLVALVIGGTFAVRSLVMSLKQKVTYPRTGYVAYRQKPPTGRTVIIVGALIIALSIFFVPFGWYNKMPVAEAELLVLVLCYMGYRVSLRRLYAAAAFVVLTLIALVAFSVMRGGVDDIVGSAVIFGAAGLALIVSGGLSLIGYLSRNQPQTEA